MLAQYARLLDGLLVLWLIKEVLMTFSFITDWTAISDMELAVMAFNLGLMYFYWDIIKFILGFLKEKLKLGGKKK